MTQRGYQIEVLSVGGDKIKDVPTTIFPYTGRLVYLQTLNAVRKQLEQVRPDFVHIHSISGFSLWSILLGDIPRMISVWGSDVLAAQNRVVEKFLTRNALKKADRITATSAFLARKTNELVPELANEITIIPFGVEIPTGVPSLPESPPLRLCLLTSYRKLYGGSVAIAAVAALRKRGCNVTLSLLYPGEMKSRYIEEAKSLGISDAVSCVDPLPNEKIPAFLSQHHLLLRPSTSDSFGVAVLEAAALGRPTIATNVGGLPEVIRHVSTGYLIETASVTELENGIRVFYDNPGLIQQYGTNARQYVSEKYAWSRSLDLMSAEYEQMRERVHS
jgi:glycosyltransferase involved in cell wall biosynthesis